MARHRSFLATLALAAALPAAGQPAPAVPLSFASPEKGHCAACHQLPEAVAPATRADLGPKLDGARMRALGRAKLREVISDPTRDMPDTVMPPFGRHRILDAREIGELVEFLHALP